MDTAANERARLDEKERRELGNDYKLTEIPFTQSREMVSYYSISEDLKLVLQYIDALKKRQPVVIERALQCAAIALYGKCFTDSRESQMSRLEPSNLFASAPNHQDIHNYVMHLRHTYTAHRGTSGEIIIPYYVLPKNGDSNGGGISVVRSTISSLIPEVLRSFEELVKYVIEHVNQKYEKAVKRTQQYCRETYILEGGS